MKNIGDYVRILISVGLLYWSYQETGLVTCIIFFLLLTRAEVQDYRAGITFKP